jgi:hypothetical protein
MARDSAGAILAFSLTQAAGEAGYPRIGQAPVVIRNTFAVPALAGLKNL